MRFALKAVLVSAGRLVVALGFAVSGLEAAADKPVRPDRVALVIANARYDEAGLSRRRAHEDAAALGTELTDARFGVDLRRDLAGTALKGAFDRLSARLRPNTTVLLYFNGLAISLSGRLFLLPTDAKIADEADVRAQGVDLDAALLALRQHGAGAQIVVVDVAHDNVFERRFRGRELGLGYFRVPRNSLVLAYSERDDDGAGNLSAFMDELVKELRTPGADFEDALYHARLGLVRATSGVEVPRFASSLEGVIPVMSDSDFVVVGDPSTTKADTSPPKPTAAPASPPSEDAAGAVVPPVEDKHATEAAAPPVAAPSGSDASDATIQDCPECPKLRAIPQGSFAVRGDVGSGAGHRIILAHGFAIGQADVTAGEWAHCVGAHGCTSLAVPTEAGRPVLVSWTDIQAYLAWLSRQTGKIYRLPSETEWAIASHAGSESIPNRLGPSGGASDTAEWTQDCWTTNPAGTPPDGGARLSGDCQQRVVRSGAGASASGRPRRMPFRVGDKTALAGFRVLRATP